MPGETAPCHATSPVPPSVPAACRSPPAAKYTAALRDAPAARLVRKEPVHAEPARRLALHLRDVESDMGTTTARLVGDALAWTLKDRELTWSLWESWQAPDAHARYRAQEALNAHRVDEIAVHDAPFVQVVYAVLEMAADEAAPPELLRAAADVLDRLVGHGNHICNPAIYGVRADGWLTASRMWQTVYTTTDPVAALAAAALRTLGDAARIPDEDELTDADCMFTLQEAVRLAVTAADLAVGRAAA